MAWVPGPEYWAGFFDADGHVRIDRFRNGERPCFVLRCGITNKNADVISACVARYGGDKPYLRPPRKSTHAPCFELHFTGKQAYAFLVDIYPHLIVKRERVGLALEYADKFTVQGGRVRERNRSLSTIEGQAQYHADLRALNKRGKAA